MSARRRKARGTGWGYAVLSAAGLVLLGWLAWNSSPGRFLPPTPDTEVVSPSPGERPPPEPTWPILPPPQQPWVTPPAEPAPPTTSTPPASPAIATPPPALPIAESNDLPQAETDWPPPPPPSWPGFPRPVQDVFELQVALSRLGISAGSIDGVLGSQTRLAVRAYQRRAGLPVNGEINAATRSHLNLDSPPTNHYLVTGEDLARLRPPARSWLEKSKRDRLDFETLLELVAEKSQAHPRLLSELNPGVAWASLTPGSVVRVPAVERPSPAKAAFFRISLSQRTLEAFDRSTNLLGHFPCSIASRVEKRPVGQLRVWVVVENPNYRFDPALFSDSPEARRIGRQLLIPPGPNNPVGTAWIGLSRPGYGIHGTPSPESVGRTESRGCFRLANWNADYVLKMAWVGLPVMVDP